MKKIILLLLVTVYLGLAGNLYAQNADTDTGRKEMYLGASLQAYPAGFIPTLTFEPYLTENTSLLFRLGANITDRQDFSDENDEEEGEGFGGSVGFRKYYPQKKGKIVAGIHLDAWNLWIDWKDNGNVGDTYIFVLQPWLEGGYYFDLKNSKSKLGITAGFGREINVITSGDDVAQDWIASIMVHYQFSLTK
ncbi:hypothetical protein U1E44_11635 [Arenibacter sp. GZD96]|uniref:hypothetical protein n=1 Tax=Aurantibrevibacter litoralis TaxID=3106030 RepID=UPI002AFF79C8|nr:hypothetical protein [Arenibacter sp. GZD-96]MEA1786747.1 hypothetical protein [Arenibacter sp. GZD-96]